MSERREILFRGKLEFGDGWVYGYLVGANSTAPYTEIFEPSDGQCWKRHLVDLSTVGQYTGLTDNNGKRIFEGDIVTIDGGDGYFLVKWDPDIARFEMSGDGLVVDFDNFYPHEFEIAGNIHDNPELLEESQ